MILNEIKPNIESSGQLEEKFFSIADQGMIFEILRNKMYSNPILAICREYSCNARDAHREVKTPEIPIHIHLPNNLEPFYKIKDFGPGISPDRMENIFIKYTASTKRTSNLQTGGFGLGCKSAFAYSDTFSIVTNFDGIQYNYSCFIDETKVGKLALFSESPTKDPNGTEIIIPVKPADFNLFRDWTEKSTRHWEVKPVIKGGNISFSIVKKTLEGNNWFFAISDVHKNYYDRSGTCKLIIDGIEYPLEIDSLKKYADTKIIDAAHGSLYLNFGVGELSLSASREQVYLDKPTQIKISNKLNEVTQQVIKIANDKIAAFPNLWEANIFFRKELSEIFHNLSIFGALSWKGIALSNHSLHIKCNVYSFSKDLYKTINPDKIKRHTQQSITFDPNSTLFVNDLPIKEPTPRHVKKIFENNDKILSVQVICPNDQMTLQMIYDHFHVDLMGVKLLSTITKATARKYTPATSRLLVFKYDALSCVFRQVSYASLEEDAAPRKILCKLTRDDYRNFRQIRLTNKNILPNVTLKSLVQKYPDIAFYGVDESATNDRIEEDFSDFEMVEDFLEKEIINNNNINYVEIKFAASYPRHIDDKPIKQLNKIQSLIKDPKSLYLKRIKIHNKIRDLRNFDSGLLPIYESIKGTIEQSIIDDFIKNNPDYDLEVLDKKYYEKYPMLEYVHMYNFNEMMPALAQYINLIDAS